MDSFFKFLELPLPQVIIGLTYILIFSSFLRLSIIYSVLCYGLGLKNLAGLITSIALALGVSIFSMSSEFETIFKDTSFNANANNSAELSKLSEALRQSLDKKIPLESKNQFIELAKKSSSSLQDESSWKIIAPAFVISEIKNALSSSLKIILPFLIIDLLVAYIFTALNITSLKSSYLSFSLKLLAFISADGLNLITTSALS